MSMQEVDKNKVKCVAVIQCDVIRHDDCRGSACALEFVRREGPFVDYPQQTIFVQVPCGGCPGKGIDDLAVQLRRFIPEGDLHDQAVVHLYACLNAHGRPAITCLHRNEIHRRLSRQSLRCVDYVQPSASSRLGDI